MTPRVREADPRRRRRQRLAAGRRVRRRVARRLEARGVPVRRDGHGLRHRRPGPRLRGHARLRRARPARRQPPGRRARDALRHRARARGVRGRDRGRRRIDPHGMDPHTVLRFVSAIGGWPGKVVVIGCEPGEVDEVGLGLTPPVEAAVERGAGAGARDHRRAAHRRGLREVAMHELSISRAVVDTAVRHAAGRRVTRRAPARRARCARSCPTRWTSTSRSSRATRVCEGARLEQELVAGAAALRGLRRSEWERRGARVPLPALRGRATSTSLAGDELEVESIEVEEEAACIA